jgi:hypothetical protein
MRELGLVFVMLNGIYFLGPTPSILPHLGVSFIPGTLPHVVLCFMEGVLREEKGVSSLIVKTEDGEYLVYIYIYI